MMLRRRTRTNSQRGAVAVEFALVFPLFITVVFGIVEYGWLFYQQFNMAGAVRDGLRQAVTISQASSPDPKATAISKVQADMAAVGIPAANFTVTAQYQGASPTRTMTVTMVMPYQRLVGLIPTPQNLQYGMTMMLELQ